MFTLRADDEPSDGVKLDPIVNLSLSSNGKLLASAGRNGKIRVWDLETPRQLFQFKVPGAYFAWVDLSQDNRHLVTGSGRSGGLAVWNVPARREVLKVPGSTRNPQFVTDTLICVDGSDGRVWFHDIASGESESFAHHDNSVIGVHVTGNEIATTSKERINVWDSQTKEVVNMLEFESPKRNLAALSPNGRWISSCRVHEPKVTIYDRSTHNVHTEIYVDFGVLGTQFNHDGSLLVVPEITGTVRLFETSQWKESGRFHLRTHQLNDLEISHEGTLVAGGDNGVISGWPVESRSQDIIQSGGELVISLKYSSDGQMLAVGSSDGRVEIYAADTGKLLFETPPRSAPSFSLDEEFFDISPDGSELAVSALRSPNVILWSLKDRRQTGTLEHDENVNAVHYGLGGKFLAAGYNKGIRLWDLQTHKTIRQFATEESCIGLAFSPNGKVIASKSWEAGIMLWNVATGEEIGVLDAHIEPVGATPCLLFSPNGALLASGGYDAQVILWDTSNWKPVRRLLGHNLHLWQLTFSPDGNRLASVAEDNWCRLWDVASGHEIARFPGASVAFSPDGNTLAVGGAAVHPVAKDAGSSGESSVRLYRAQTLEEIDQRQER